MLCATRAIVGKTSRMYQVGHGMAIRYLRLGGAVILIIRSTMALSAFLRHDAGSCTRMNSMVQAVSECWYYWW